MEDQYGVQSKDDGRVYYSPYSKLAVSDTVSYFLQYFLGGDFYLRKFFGDFLKKCDLGR